LESKTLSNTKLKPNLLRFTNFDREQWIRFEFVPLIDCASIVLRTPHWNGETACHERQQHILLLGTLHPPQFTPSQFSYRFEVARCNQGKPMLEPLWMYGNLMRQSLQPMAPAKLQSSGKTERAEHIPPSQITPPVAMPAPKAAERGLLPIKQRRVFEKRVPVIMKPCSRRH